MIIVTGSIQARLDTVDELRLVFFKRWADKAARLSARPPTLATCEASEISLR